MPICGNAPFLHTAYMQSTVLSFSCNGGWGLQSGQLKVELADGVIGELAQRGKDSLGMPDRRCSTFNPGPVGSPTLFEYNGFEYTGLLKGWEEDVSMGGRKYSVTVETPHVILDNTQVVLKHLDDFDPTVAYGGPGPIGKYINVHLEVAPRPFQGMTYFSYCNKVGCSWGDLYGIMHNNWRFRHKGFTYVLDISQIGPALGPGPWNYKIAGDGMSVLGVIEQFAQAQCRRVRLELWPAGSVGSLGGNHTIKVVADNIAVQPPPAILMNQPSTTGNIRARLAAGGGWKLLSVQTISTCALSGGVNDILQQQKYGLEAANEISDALIVGDNMRMMYECADHSGECGNPGPLCISPNPNGFLGSGDAPIRHYWGEQADSRGNMVPIVSTGCGDDEIFYVDVSAQMFFRTIQGVTIPFLSCLTNSRYYPVTVLEIRAAGNSFESWFEYMCEFKMNCLIEFFSPALANTDFQRFNLDSLLEILQIPGRGYSPDDAVRTNEDVAAVAEQMHRDRRDAAGVEGLRALHSFVKKFTSYYGQQFAITLPAGLITCCTAGTNPALVAGLEASEFAWAWNDGTLGGGFGPVDTVLGLPWSSVPLEIFKNDDGGCKPILYYECVKFEPDNEGARGATRNVGIDFAKITVPWFVQPMAGCPTKCGQGESGHGMIFGGASTGVENPGTIGRFVSAGVQGHVGTVSRAFVKPGWETEYGSPMEESMGDISHPLDRGLGAAEAAPNPTIGEHNPGYRLWLQCNVKKIHDPCDLIGNGPVAVMATPSPIFLRPVDTSGNRTGNSNALWDILLSNRIGRELTEEEKERLNSLLATPGGQGLRGMGLIPKAHMPIAAAVTFKDNSRTYPSTALGTKFFDSTTADSKAYFERNEALSPWKSGGLSIMNNAGRTLAISITSAQEAVESGSLQYAGTPLQANISGLGASIGGVGTEVESLTLTVGMSGVTTTVSFRTFMTNFGELGKNEAERIAASGRAALRTQRALNLRLAEELMEAIRQVFMDVDGDDTSEGINDGDSSTVGVPALTLALPNNANENDFILGFNWATEQDDTNLDDVGNVGNYSSLQPLRAAITAMGADDAGRDDMEARNNEWRIRGGMSLDGLIRPYQFVDEYGDVKTPGQGPAGYYGKINNVMPPYKLVKTIHFGADPDTGWCARESYANGNWPAFGINNFTLCPFMTGHDIKRGVFESEYPTDGIEFYEKTATGNAGGASSSVTDSSMGGAGPTQLKHIRPYALKGPMVMAGWGYDIDGYPVPNISQPSDLSEYKPEDREYKFLEEHLTRQDQWKVGPIDLRWDEHRGVWTAKPANKFKIIPFKIIGEWVYESEISNWEEGEFTETYDPKTGQYNTGRNPGKGYKVYSALASSEPACTADVCCIGPIVETGKKACSDTDYENTPWMDQIDYDSKVGVDHVREDFLSDWTGYPEKYAPCDSVPAEEFCANNDNVTFKVYDVLDLYAEFGEGDVGFAYRDFDCSAAFTIIEMGHAGGDRCMIRETTEFIDDEDGVCDLQWRIGKSSYQLNSGDPNADEDRKDEQTQAPEGTDGCMPCTLEETFWIDTEGHLTMFENDQCEIITENARYDFNFDVHTKQYLGHVPTGGADSFDEDGNPLDEDGNEMEFDPKKGPCVIWMDADDGCLIPKMPSVEDQVLTLGQRGVAPGWGGMACSLENTYKFTQTPDLGEDFKGWTVVEPVSPNSKYDHNFNPNKEQVLTHKKIAWKRVIGGIDGQNDDLAPEGPIVWWDDMGGCAIPEESSPVDLEDGEGLHVGEFKHIEFGMDVQFPCNLEKTYWMQPNNYPTNTRSNWESHEKDDFFDNYNVPTADDAANGDLYEVSENLRDSAGRGRKAEFNPIWRQVLGHTHTKFPLTTTGPSFQQYFSQVAWAPEWYATIPSFTLKEGGNGVNRLHELYYVMDEAGGTGQYGAVPGVRPDYDIDNDKSKLRFGQEVFPETLWQTYQHSGTDVDEHSTYLGEGNNYWGFTRKNKYNFDPNRLQVFAHFAAATEDEDNQVTSIDNATTSTPKSSSDDFEENNGPFIKWLDYSGCTLPKETEEGPDLDTPWIFGQNCLPCKFEQTLGYAVSDRSGTRNGGYNDTTINPAVKNFGFDPNKKQYLGHVQEGGDDFIESGEDGDFDASVGPCIEWFDHDDQCDIREEGDFEGEDDDEKWRFGKDQFPCTLEETYKTRSIMGTGSWLAWPLPEPHGPSKGLLSQNWWQDDQDDTISKNAVNDFNFRPDIIQFLGHVPNLGENCDELEYHLGPKIKWMQPYLIGIPYRRQARNEFDPCQGSSENKKMWGQDVFPPSLEFTYVGDTNTNADGDALDNVDDGPASRNQVDRFFPYNFDSADFQVLSHVPGGGYMQLGAGQRVRGGDNSNVGPNVKWDFGPFQIVDIGAQRSSFPCTLQETLYGSSAQFTSNFASKLKNFNYDKDKEQVLCHTAQTKEKDNEGNETDQKDDKVFWEELKNLDSGSCDIPKDANQAPVQGADQYHFPCNLEQTYGNSFISFHTQNDLTNPKDFGFDDNQNQYLGHHGDGSNQVFTAGVPNVAWIDACQIEVGPGGAAGGTHFFPCNLYNTYYDPAGGPAVQGNGTFHWNRAGMLPAHDFGYEEARRQCLGHNMAAEGGVGGGGAGIGDVWWMAYPAVPYAAAGALGSADFPLFMSDMYGGAPVAWVNAGRRPNTQTLRGGDQPENIPSIQDRVGNGLVDRNWKSNKFQAVAHLSTNQTATNGLGARVPTIEWVDMTRCEIDPRDFVRGGGKKWGSSCLPCFLQDTYKNAGANWTEDNFHDETTVNDFGFNPAIEQVLMHDKAAAGLGPCVKWGLMDGCAIQSADQACHPCTLEDTYFGAGLTDEGGNAIGIGADGSVTGFQYDPAKMQVLAHFKGGHGGSDKDCVSWLGLHVFKGPDDGGGDFIDHPGSGSDPVAEKFPCYLWETMGPDEASSAVFDKTDYDWSQDAHNCGYDKTEVQVLGHTKGENGPEKIQWMTVKDCDEAEDDNGDGDGASDERLKKDIKLVGKSPSGINIYEFTFVDDIHYNFKGLAGMKFRGALYQEVKKSHPDCVKRDRSGYGMISYNKIDVDFEEIED